MMRFEKEQQQKEIRQEMKLRLARLQQQQHQQQHQQQLSQHKPQIIIGDTLMMQHGATLSRITMATPSYVRRFVLIALKYRLMKNIRDSVTSQQLNIFIIQNYPPKTETKCTTETVVSATLTALKTAASSSPKVNNQTNIAVTDIANAAAYIGPCNSSNEAL
uniref:Uncharacterized protein n=1 Tax=Glossina pallidipes TaxID=7398 RepID=A0A1A9ZKN7_GLOPL